MLISAKTTALLQEKCSVSERIFCSGLFLSARWFVLSQVAEKGLHFIVLPTREAAEYCAADLYNLVEGDVVFFLPDSGKAVERSNFKSSLGVQRTSAIGKLLNHKDDGSLLFIVTYPEALEEKIPEENKLKGALLTLHKGDTIRFDTIRETLSAENFEKVDFVSAPGQYAFRGSLIDIFSYSDSMPFRVSFWGNEIDSIHIFN